MLQAAIFRREAVDQTLAVDNSTDQCSYRDDAMWPVDYHFWLSFFHGGLEAGKIPDVLFYWRQHCGQQTRNHGRLSISNLRKCKCYFLCKHGGPIWTAIQECSRVEGLLLVEVWSTANTLTGWVEDLKAELVRAQQHNNATVRGVVWKPGKPKPVEGCPTNNSGMRLLRLFAFGMEKTRLQVREEFAEAWDDDRFMFVA